MWLPCFAQKAVSSRKFRILAFCERFRPAVVYPRSVVLEYIKNPHGGTSPLCEQLVEAISCNVSISASNPLSVTRAEKVPLHKRSLPPNHSQRKGQGVEALRGDFRTSLQTLACVAQPHPALHKCLRQLDWEDAQDCGMVWWALHTGVGVQEIVFKLGCMPP